MAAVDFSYRDQNEILFSISVFQFSKTDGLY